MRDSTGATANANRLVCSPHSDSGQEGFSPGTSDRSCDSVKMKPTGLNDHGVGDTGPIRGQFSRSMLRVSDQDVAVQQRRETRRCNQFHSTDRARVIVRAISPVACWFFLLSRPASRGCVLDVNQLDFDVVSTDNAPLTLTWPHAVIKLAS